MNNRDIPKVGRTSWSARVPLDPFFANGSKLCIYR
jgi:hypothetical protein